MLARLPERTARWRRLPVGAYVKLNRWMWRRLPPALAALPPVRAHGRRLHRLVRTRAARRQYFGTYFLRNRPQLALIHRVAAQRARGATLRMAFLACSNGAEVYSLLWTIRSQRPDLTVIAHAVDISAEILELARTGVYSLRSPALVEAPIFERLTDRELHEMFDVDRGLDEARVKAWIRDGVAWHVADAGSPELVDTIGRQDIVVANNFLCHMTPPEATRCLRTIARLVRPGGHLFVAGVDLDVRTTVALDLGWRPVREAMEAIHEGDPAVRRDWPLEYWGLEPLDRGRRDWSIRYASAFRL
jgi:SAM-dependent methyltransferase